MSMSDVIVIGGGLAGCEASWQIAGRGFRVTLFEMRPAKMTPAHQTGYLSELVCSNSLGSNLPDRAPGLLKAELRHLRSLIIACADATSVPAGGALAVDREAFARRVTEQIESHPLIEVRREEVRVLEHDGRFKIIATGPLTSDSLADQIAAITGRERLYFYDAMAPIVYEHSIDFSKVFKAARYGRGGDDYINCPMSREEYDRFVESLVAAETIPLREFEQDKRFFEACLPVEVIAARGHNALAYGPLRPVGLTDPRTGRRPWAVVQLRQDNRAGTLYNIVGFQTNLRWSEQRRVFRLIPGLENAEFARFGQMHRNTFIDSPRLLEPTMQLKGNPAVFFAGQIVGMEGYVASAASGLVAGINVARLLRGLSPVIFPATTMLGALCQYITCDQLTDFQPMKPNYGLLPGLSSPVHRSNRNQALSKRAIDDMLDFIARNSLEQVDF